MHNILIGNGFNLQIGGSEYSNCSIVERLHYNLENKDYREIFNCKVDNNDLITIFDGLENQVLQETLQGIYDNLCETLDEDFNLKRFKLNYTQYKSIGMEDYFLLLRLFCHEYKDSDAFISSVEIGVKQLFLDAIFNDGKIQNLYEKVDSNQREELKTALSQFDNIFTVNYDCNIEQIVKKEVKYMHGQFNKLHSQYRQDEILSIIAEKKGIKTTITDENYHLYCNAIMGFSGNLKQTIVKTFNYLNSDEYPTKDFTNITGSLSLAGLSPNNDEHIITLIRNNKNLEEIIFYYHSEIDMECAKSLNINVKLRPISDLW